ncbi:MAG: glycosyltransferase family 9 protein [Elusimicrobia bacterium]|nr:glycosyltransferase family 9 protein [Elusimicrobiota bacterium]
MKKAEAPCRRILLLCAGGIGDFIEAVPSIAALRGANPERFIGLLAVDRCAEYARRCPQVDRVYAWPYWNNEMGWMSKFWRGLQALAILWKMRKDRFDAVFNFMGLGSKAGAFRMRMLVRCLGVRTAAGRDTDGLGDFYDLKVPEHERERKSESDYFHAVARLLEADLPAPRVPTLWILSCEKDQVDAWLRDWGEAGPLFLLHPGGDRETRRWFAPRYARLVTELSVNYKARFAILGSAGDVPIAENIARSAPGAAIRIFSGRANLGQSLELIRRARILICNNSMAMHAAAAAGTPCVVVCASGDIRRDRPPWNREKTVLLWKPFECSPCYFWSCPKPRPMECMERISVAEVLRACDSLLAPSKR